jgi:hypothetical protein
VLGLIGLKKEDMRREAEGRNKHFWDFSFGAFSCLLSLENKNVVYKPHVKNIFRPKAKKSPRETPRSLGGSLANRADPTMYHH